MAESQRPQHVKIVADSCVAGVETVDEMAVDQARVTFVEADAILAAGREQREAHRVDGGAHVDDHVVMDAVYRLTHLPQIAPHGMALLLGERNDMVD